MWIPKICKHSTKQTAVKLFFLNVSHGLCHKRICHDSLMVVFDGVYTFVFWRSGSDPLPGWKTLAEMAGQKLCFQSTLGTEEAKCEFKNLFDCCRKTFHECPLAKKAEFSNIDAIFFKCKEQRRIIFGHRFFQLSIYFCDTATASKMMVTMGSIY